VPSSRGRHRQRPQREANHPKILDQLRKGIEFAAGNGVPNVICMAAIGRSRARPFPTRKARYLREGLKQVVGLAEQKNVTLIMEGLNSKVNHKDYMYDKTEWGVQLCKRSARRGSSCSTTSTTCRSWKAT